MAGANPTAGRTTARTIRPRIEGTRAVVRATRLPTVGTRAKAIRIADASTAPRAITTTADAAIPTDITIAVTAVTATATAATIPAGAIIGAAISTHAHTTAMESPFRGATVITPAKAAVTTTMQAIGTRRPAMSTPTTAGKNAQ